MNNNLDQLGLSPVYMQVRNGGKYTRREHDAQIKARELASDKVLDAFIEAGGYGLYPEIGHHSWEMKGTRKILQSDAMVSAQEAIKKALDTVPAQVISLTLLGGKSLEIEGGELSRKFANEVYAQEGMTPAKYLRIQSVVRGSALTADMNG